MYKTTTNMYSCIWSGEEHFHLHDQVRQVSEEPTW